MKMDKVAGSGNDEFYTPKYAVEPILKYLDSSSVYLCSKILPNKIVFEEIKK